jgi:hypothetical protein
MDAEMDGMATGLSTAICRDGQSTATARIPFAAGIGMSDGSVGTPAINFTGDTNSGIYVIGPDNIGVAAAGAKVLDIGTAGLGVTGTLIASGAATLSSTAAVTGNFAVNTDKFTVAAASGNTVVAGTLGVTGAATLSSTLGVTGAATLSSTAAVTGNFAVNTDKFTVAAASGNTLVAGTLAVTGNTTLSGDLIVGGSPIGLVCLQRSRTVLDTEQTISSAIPIDDTIPQIGEGTLITESDVTFTPVSASSVIRILSRVSVRMNAATMAVAMFIDGAGNSVASSIHADASGLTASQITVSYEYSPASTNQIAIQLNAGINTGSGTINGTETMGGTRYSEIIIEEWLTL